MKKKVKDNVNEINPYKLDKFSKVPSWLIVLLLKYWAAAAAVFFSTIGGISVGFDFTNEEFNLVQNLNASERLIIFIALVMALCMNYIVKPMVLLMYNRRNNTKRYNMINVRGIFSLFLSLGYNFLLSIIMFFVTITLSYNGLVFDPFGTTGGVGIEPFTYALWYILLDFICLFIKNVITMISDRIKYKKQMTEEVWNV